MELYNYHANQDKYINFTTNIWDLRHAQYYTKCSIFINPYNNPTGWTNLTKKPEVWQNWDSNPGNSENFKYPITCQQVMCWK